MPTMRNNTNAMAEKILLDIANVFSKDDLLEEFDILPVETNNCNRSPVIHAEHALGLEGWCMKNIYHYCYNVLMEQYISKANNKSMQVNMDNCEEVDRLLMGALLINPDMTTFWNKRREMYSKRFFKFSEEMKFTRVVLSRKPKCNEAFAYRKWLLERYWSEPVGNQCLRVAATADAELSVTESCAQKSPNNYHAWTHRIWLMKQMNRHTSPGICLYLFMGELKFSELWISSNVSDHSGLHYRQFALKCAADTNKGFTFLEGDELYKYVNSVNIMMQHIVDPGTEHLTSDKEIMCNILGYMPEDVNGTKVYAEFYQRVCYILYDLLLNEELIRTYSSHEVLWYHRRFIVKSLLNIFCEYFDEGKFKPHAMIYVGMTMDELSGKKVNRVKVCEEIPESLMKEVKMLRHHNHTVYNSPLYQAFSINEIKFIDQRSKCGDIFAVKYHKWLRFILGCPV